MTARLTWFFIRLYQYTLGTILPNSCRFQPTCSEYALQAVQKRGAFGYWLALRRILRCHPWGGYGYDPVPERTSKLRTHSSAVRTRNSRATELGAADTGCRTEDK